MEAQTIVLELRARGLSQSAIATAVDLTQGAISAIERGRRADVRASTLGRLKALQERYRASADQAAA